MAEFNGQLRIPDGSTSFLNSSLIRKRGYPPGQAEAVATYFLTRSPHKFKNLSFITVIGDREGSITIMDDAHQWVRIAMAAKKDDGAKKAGAKKAGAKKGGAKKVGAKKGGAKKAGAK